MRTPLHGAHAETAPLPSPRTWLADELDGCWDEARLAALVPGGAGVPAALWDKALLAPVREMLSRPGKGFRAELVSLGWRLGGGEGRPPAKLLAALEILHAGSMIIDDIEDGSRQRRGRPCLHLVHDPALALNAGNWMYFWPLALLGELGLAASVRNALRERTMATLLDCHFGQALDLGAKIGEVAQSEVAGVVATTTALKTGRLTALAAAMGAEAAGASPARVEALAAFGTALGEGLQQLDDLGNLAPAAEGKRFEDLRLGRLTWPWAWGAQAWTPSQFERLSREGAALYAAARAGAPLERREEALARELRAAVEVTGRAQVHQRLQKAMEGLESAVGERAELRELAGHVARLEASYG